MEYIEEIKAAKSIKIIKSFVEAGYVPSRGGQAYTFNGFYVNSFEHAFLNLTNSKIEEMLKVNHSAGDIFKRINGNGINKINTSYVEQNMNQLADEIGLKVSETTEEPLKLAKNQWRIALYLNPYQCHFALQEKNGSWTSKEDWAGRIKRLTALPKYYPATLHGRNPFKLEKYYIITNPYAESE